MTFDEENLPSRPNQAKDQDSVGDDIIGGL